MKTLTDFCKTVETGVDPCLEQKGQTRTLAVHVFEDQCLSVI